MIRRVLILGVITMLWTYADSLQFTRIVETKSGPVRGEEINLKGFRYKAFKGIPYVAPPVGNLRFRAPQPHKQWTRVRDAVKFGAICPQPTLPLAVRMRMDIPYLVRNFFSNAQNLIETLRRYITDREDCLTLNVYTTQLGEEGLKPVLVYIHGGAFIVGDGTDIIYGPEFLIQRDIVLVTFNYRLGILGFLATNTSDSPGNYGLKDQVAALRWVQDNIARFGGDPKQVTISGQSAGSASVHFHMLSPISKGLFHRVIASSGSATCPWSTNENASGYSREVARLARASPSEIEDPAKLVKFLRTLEAKYLSGIIWRFFFSKKIFSSGLPNTIPFTAVVEPPGTEGAFLTEDPKKLIAEGRFTKVPLMMGVTDLEGAVIFMGFSAYRSPADLRKVNIDICTILPQNLKQSVNKSNACPAVSKQLLDVYFGGKPTSTSPLEFLHLFGDMFLVHGVHEAQKWHARYSKKDSPVYLYYYTYDGEWKLLKDLIALKLPGVMHGDEIGTIFKSRMAKLPDLAPSSPGHRNQERVLSFITNFVKYGNPTPKTTPEIPILWEPATGEDLNTMNIGVDLKLEKNVLKKRMDVWDSIYKNYIGDTIYR